MNRAYGSLILFLFALQCVTAQTGFEKNLGQLIDQYGQPNTDVKYLFQGEDLSLHLRKTGFSYELKETEAVNSESRINSEKRTPSKTRFNRIDLDFFKPRKSIEIIEAQPCKAVKNYYRDSGSFEGVPSFKKITYPGVYKGIDVVFKVSKSGQAKYDFIINKKALLSEIKIQCSGFKEIQVEPKCVKFYTEIGEIQDSIPISFYSFKGALQNAEVNYVNYGNGLIGFKLISSSKEGELIIDPVPQVAWGTYAGRNSAEYGKATCFTPDLEVILAGETRSTGFASSGAHDETYDDLGDAFISKYSESGELLWSTYYGGSHWDSATDVVCDLSGNIIFTGWFGDGTYAASSGALQNSFGGDEWDAALVKLSPNGTRLWGTFYGGDGDDEGFGLAVNNFGEIMLAGSSSTNTSESAIATAGSYQENNAGGYDSFLAKFSANGNRQWGTFFGGTLNESIYTKFGVDFDEDDNIVIASWSTSTSGIATPGAYKTVNENHDGYLAKFDLNGSLLWATYLGGTGVEFVTSVIFDLEGNILISGETTSSDGVAHEDAFQPIKAGDEDGFIQKFSPNGEFITGTYLGGEAEDFCFEIDNYCNDILVYGITGSDDFPVSTATYQTERRGGTDAFISMMNDDLSELSWSTYYGGESDELDHISIIGMESSSRYGGTQLAITGTTSSSDFIASAAGDDTSLGGSQDAFLATLEVNLIDDLISFESDTICEGTTLELSVNGAYTTVYWGEEFNDSDTIYVDPTESTVYQLEVTTESGCVFTDSVSVQVEPLPNLEIEVSDSEICLGESVTITATGAASYSWPPGISNGEEITPDQAGNQSHLITGFSESGCSNSQTVPFSVYEIPEVGAIASELSICEGDSLMLVGTGAQNYAWSSGVENNVWFFPLIGTENYMVTGTSGSAECQNEDSVSVTVHPLPEITPSLSETEICLMDSVLVSCTGDAHSYDWSNDLLNGLYFTPTEAGSLSLFVTGINVDTRCEVTEEVVLEVSDEPIIEVGFESMQICEGESVTLLATGAEAFVWTNGIMNGEEITLTESGEYIYTVEATNEIGCAGTREVEVLVEPCNTDIFLPTGISPNFDGVNDKLEIESNGAPVEIKVFSEWGFLLYESKDYQNDWYGTNERGAAFAKQETLPVGTYYYVVKISEEIYKNYLYINY